MSKLANVLQALRFMPALPVGTWYALALLGMLTQLANYVLALTLDLWSSELNTFCIGVFVLLFFTPTERVVYRVHVLSEMRGSLWLEVDKRMLANAITDERVTELHRVTLRDGRIKRVEPLPLPGRET